MVLVIKNLTKFYDRKQVLDNLNLEINRGEIYGLLGANGAGKTTLINIICGLVKYNHGSILFNNQPLNHQAKYLLGIATQENLLYTHLSCRENLEFFGKIYGLTGTKLTSNIYRSLESVKLVEYQNEIVANLSGGMQRRLNMAIALIHNPQLLILDEPTTGLDIEIRYDIWQLIFALKKQGMTILLTTHLLDEAEKLCDRIGIMKTGKIIEEGSLAQLRQLLPTQELVFIKTNQEEELILQANQLGWQHRYYNQELVFFIPENLDLKTIIQQLGKIELRSIRKENTNLQHIYLEVSSH